jgi:mono/diheme cytochrome c family protein
VLIAAVLWWMELGTSLAQEAEVRAAGQQEYHRYCRTCHGETGKGDGIMARYLTVTPADLTQLRTKYGGQFPFWDVYATIEGRKMVTAHGDGEVPIWGALFRWEEGGNNKVVRGRILQLVYYLQSIQAEPR